MIFKNCSLLFGPSHIFQVATWFEKLFPKKILSRGRVKVVRSGGVATDPGNLTTPDGGIPEKGSAY